MPKSHRKGVLRGPKITCRHSTWIPAAEPLILAAKLQPEVSKVVIGPIRKLGPGLSRITYKRIPAGLSATVRGTGSVQAIYVYTSNPEATEATLLAVDR